jgi:hypothetical protein
MDNYEFFEKYIEISTLRDPQDVELVFLLAVKTSIDGANKKLRGFTVGETKPKNDVQKPRLRRAETQRESKRRRSPMGNGKDKSGCILF